MKGLNHKENVKRVEEYERLYAHKELKRDRRCMKQSDESIRNDGRAEIDTQKVCVQSKKIMRRHDESLP